MTRAAMHPELPHLTHLGYYIIGGGQPTGRTDLLRKPKGPNAMEQAAQVVMQALERARIQANAPRVATMPQ